MPLISFMFLTLGIAFIAIGSSDQQTFLWAGVSFLVIGVMGLVLRRKGTAPAAADEEKQRSIRD